MDRKIWFGLDDWSITEALFTWNGENNTKSIGYEMTKNKKNEKKQKEATIPETTGRCPLLWHFLPANNIRPESKEIIIITITIIIIIIIINGREIWVTCVSQFE